jgi:YVTN family beta-propeller protein
VTVKYLTTVVLALLVLLAGVASADWVSGPIFSDGAAGVTVNPIANKLYVPMYQGVSLAVIDALTGENIGVQVDNGPSGVAFNPVTNKIYVTCDMSNYVDVIDAATNQRIAQVNVGIYFSDIVLNPLTNKIYVRDAGPGYPDTGCIAVIDGATNSVQKLYPGAYPMALAINPVTNKIYVASYHSLLTVIDGATNNMTQIALGDSVPHGISINPVTNKIYVSVSDAQEDTAQGTIAVVDGDDNSVTLVPITSGFPYDCPVVSPTYNKAFVATAYHSLSVLDAANNVTTVATDSMPLSPAINSLTNKVYIPNYFGSNVTVYNTAAEMSENLEIGDRPEQVAVNPLTNRAYVSSSIWGVKTIVGTGGEAATTPLGNAPCAVAFDPVWGFAYICSDNGDCVTIVEEATGDTTHMPTGSSPVAVAADPSIGKAFVANNGTNTVTVIDLIHWDTATVTTGYAPAAVAVNPATHRAYVANYASSSLTEIDGVTLATRTFGTGTHPSAVCVNPTTNRIYVLNYGDATVFRLDAETGDTTTIRYTGADPRAMALNPFTNRLYVANGSGGTITEIDCASETPSHFAISGTLVAVAVDQFTNKVYFADYTSNQVKVFAPDSGRVTATIDVGAGACALALDPVSNRLFVANYFDNSVSVIDCATNHAVWFNAGTAPEAVGVDPVTGIAISANYGNSTITTLYPGDEYGGGITVSLSGLPGDTTTSARPLLTGTGKCRQSPNRTKMLGVIGRTLNQPFNWTQTTGGAGTDSISWNWTWGSDSLNWGENFLVLAALDCFATSTNTRGPGTPACGQKLVQPVYRVKVFTGVETGPGASRDRQVTLSVAPNPAHSRISVSYTLPQSGPVSLKLYDASGRLARTLVNAAQNPGRYSVPLDPTAGENSLLSPGVYFVKLKSGDCRITKKLILE